MPRLTASQKHLVEAALDDYGLRGSRLTVLQADRQLVFKVDAGAPYALRVYYSDGPDRRAVWSQCQWLRAIARDTELVVPEPVSNASGDDVTALHGGGAGRSFCTLTKWVPGQPRFRPNGPGAAVLRQVGRIMATLHTHGASFDMPTDFRCPRWDYAGLFGPRSPWRPATALTIDRATRRAFQRIMRRTHDVMRSLGTGRDVFGLIHGDLTQPNYVVHRGSVSPIDFGDFGRGYFLYDAAVTLLMLKPFDRTGAQRRAFLAGYRDVRPLLREHEELLDTLIAGRAVVLARWALGARKPDAGNLRWVKQTLPWLRDFAEASR
jgi:Ser/Thr protein kinase RdoA (MazF antagonist)